MADSPLGEVLDIDSETRHTSMRRRSRLILVLGIALVGVVALAACSGGRSPAPDFQIELYQGEGVLGSNILSLSDLYGTPLVVNFWAGLCPPCRAEMPDIQEFYNEFSDEITLVGVDIGVFVGLGSQDDGRKLLEEKNITYPAGFSPSVDPVRDYKILNMPTTVFITEDGEIFRKWAGLLDKKRTRPDHPGNAGGVGLIGQVPRRFFRCIGPSRRAQQHPNHLLL